MVNSKHNKGVRIKIKLTRMTTLIKAKLKKLDDKIHFDKAIIYVKNVCNKYDNIH